MKRDQILDIFKGIGIILVLISHGQWGFWAYKYATLANLPIFFFASGMLINASIKKYSLGQYLKRKIQTIFIPFVLAVSVYFLFGLLDSKVGVIFSCDRFINIIFRASSYDFQEANMQLYFWFLPFFFLFSFIQFVIFKYLKKDLILIVFILLAIAMRLFLLSQAGLYVSTKVPFSMDKLPLALLIGISGNLFGDFKDKIDKYKGPILLGLLLVLVFGTSTAFDLRKMDLGQGGVIDYLVVSIFACGFVYILSELIFKKSRILTNIFSWVGKNSLFIFLLHGFVYPYFHTRMIGRVTDEMYIFYSLVVLVATIVITFIYMSLENLSKRLVCRK